MGFLREVCSIESCECCGDSVPLPAILQGEARGWRGSPEPVGPAGNPRCMTLRRRVTLIVAIVVLAPIVLLAGLVLGVPSGWGAGWARGPGAHRNRRAVGVET